MGLRYRSSFKLFPGVRLNLSKSGVSASFGVPGATLNLGPHGARATVSLPGTGLSYSTKLGGGANTAPAWPSQESASYQPGAPTAPEPEHAPAIPTGNVRTIASASIERRTSEGLQSLKGMLVEARRQHREIQEDLGQAEAQLAAETAELAKKRGILFRFFYKRRITELTNARPELQAEVERLRAWLEATHIDMAFEIGDEAQRTYGALVSAFEALSKSEKIWDVTAEADVDRHAERSVASTAVTRTPVKLSFSSHELVRFSGSAMRFENTNGEDILIYPAVALTPRADGEFALVDLRDLNLRLQQTRFVEAEAVPSDAQVVSQAWYKANRDGSPDRRFKDNYQIPVCLYGDLTFHSVTGLLEGYSVSNGGAAIAFATALEAHRGALVRSAAEKTA